MSLAQCAALLGGIILGVLFWVEVHRWKSLRSVIGHRQRMLRIMLIVLMEGLFAMVLVGPWILGEGNILGELVYWTIGILLGMAVLILALFDLREVGKRCIVVNREVFGKSDKDDPRNGD